MSTNTDETTVILDIGHTGSVYAVVFHPDGEHVLGGSSDGVRRWRLSDGQEVGRLTTGTDVNAISVSKDHKRVVCGTNMGTSVWDEELREKIVDVDGTDYVLAVDVSSDGTRFATGTLQNTAHVWSISNGERLVGPLENDNWVTGIKFSPDGDYIATSCYSASNIRVFDSRDGVQLVKIETTSVTAGVAITPLAWSGDGRKIFCAFGDTRIKSFDVSTGSRIFESSILHDSDNIDSFALSTNGKFIATIVPQSIIFLDASTLARFDSVVHEDSQRLRSIAVSPNSRYVATGRSDGKIVIRDLAKILPDSYGPFHIPVRERTHSLASGGQGNTKPMRREDAAEGHHGDGSDDRLSVEVSSSTSGPEFDYDEPPSPAFSGHLREVENLPSHTIPRSPDSEPVTSAPDVRAEEEPDTVKSSQAHSIFRKWLRKKSTKDAASNKPVRRSASGQSRSHSPPKADATNAGPSWMVAGKRKRRTVAKSWGNEKRKPPTNQQNSGNRPRPRAVDPVQRTAGPSEPTDGRVHLTVRVAFSSAYIVAFTVDQHQEGSGDATLSIRFPAWMFCIRSDAHDETR